MTCQIPRGLPRGSSFEFPGVNEMYGIDISIGQLSRCRTLICQRGWKVELFLATAEALPFREATFSNILHIGGINFFSDKKQAMEEMIRVARPGGKIVIADEVERLAKRVDQSVDVSASGQGAGGMEASISNLVPSSMEEKRLEGIWRLHGKDHGYCLEFRKPG